MKKAIKLLSTSLLLSVTFSHISHGMDEDGGDRTKKEKLSGTEARKATESKVITASPKKAPRPQAPKPTEGGTVTPKEGSTSAPTTPAKVGTPKRPTSSPSSSRTSSPAKGTPRKDLNHKLYPSTGIAYSIESYKGEWVPEWLYDNAEYLSGENAEIYKPWRVGAFDLLLEIGDEEMLGHPINEIACAYVHLQLQGSREVSIWKNGMNTGTFGTDHPTPNLPYVFEYAAAHGHVGMVKTFIEKAPTALTYEHLATAMTLAIHTDQDRLPSVDIMSILFEPIFSYVNRSEQSIPTREQSARRKTLTMLHKKLTNSSESLIRKIAKNSTRGDQLAPAQGFLVKLQIITGDIASRLGL